MQQTHFARTLSRLEARAMLERLGRARPFDQLVDHHLEAWSEELAARGLSLHHELRLRDGDLRLELSLAGAQSRVHFSVQVNSIDCVFVLRERVRDFPVLSAVALMAVLRERLDDALNLPAAAGALAPAAQMRQVLY